jgi:uncharacterized protein (TIGR02996 family)
MAKRPGAAKARTLRLERGEGKERVFWEIACTKVTITTRFGRWLNEGRRVEKRLGSAAEAEQLVAKLIADKRKDGYEDPPRKLAAGASSVKGVSMRNAELEALIDDDPHDPQGYLVYADWLQQQGDARGELIIVQHGLSLDPDDAALARAESTLLKTFEEELLGPLARYTHIRTNERSFKGLAWRYGFVRAARFRRTARAPLSASVRLLLEHASGRFLERLVLGHAISAGDPERDLGPVFEVLATAAPRTLDWLVIGEGHFSWNPSAEAVHLDGLWAAMPRLRCLALGSAQPVLGTVRAEGLEELVVLFADQPEVAAIAGARWPRLNRLSLTLTIPTQSPRALAALFAARGLPSLAHLTVHRWLTRDYESGAYGEPVLVQQDALAHDTLEFAASRRLGRLDLDMPLTEAGAAAILGLRTLSSIGTITLPAEAIGSAKLRASLVARFPNVVFTDARIDESPGTLETLDADQGALAGSGPSRDARNE